MKTRSTLLRFLFLFAGLVISTSAFAQPANDVCGGAQVLTPDGTCVNGTTVNATDNWTGTVGCQAGGGTHRDVWYSFVATGSNFTGTVTPSAPFTGNAEFVLASSATGCTGPFTIVGSNCGSPATLNATGLTVGATYYVTVSGTNGGTPGPFQICVTTSNPPVNCTDNDDCATPTPITYTTGVQTCITDCNTGANPGPDFAGNNCYDFPDETVWYQVTTGASTAEIDVALTSGSLTAPVFTVFTTANCINYTIVNCTEGAAGSATATVAVSPNTTYLIAVSDQNGATGNFNLCVTVQNDNSACNTNDVLAVTATSMGSPLSGPYQAGEIVTFCYTINNWNPGASCNYLQGIVPTFGDCWDPVSFNAQGRPVTITTALTTQGTVQPCGPGPPCPWATCANTSAGNWSWFPSGSVTYNNITGSLPAGSALPGGWFFLTSYDPLTNACAPDPTDPDNSFGDNNFPNCDATLDWTVCFQLQARSSSACTSGLTDCSVSVKTYSDGEIGAWNNVGCVADIPATFAATLACCTPPVSNAGVDATICSGGTASIGAAPAAGVTYSWSPATGLSSATASNPTVTLTNAGTTATVNQYVVTSTAGGCSSTDTVRITVNPVPGVTATPASQTICNNGTTSINLTSAVAGTTFSWTAAGSAGTVTGFANGSGSSIAQTLANSGTTSETVTYTITPTANTCPGNTVNVVVTVNPTPSATATPAAQTICSGGTTSIALSSTVTGTTFAWTASGTAGTSGFSNASGSTIAQALSTTGTTAGTVTYTVTPTAATCPGAPISVAITVNPTPNATATPASQTICSGSTTSIALSSNVAGATFAWTASGTAGTSGFSNSSGSTIAQALSTTGTTAGTVTYTVTPTAATCPGSPISVAITVNPTPNATATPASQTICSGGTTSIALSSNVAGATFAWTASGTAGTSGFSNSSGSTIGQTLSTTGTTAGTVTYTVTPTAATCPGAPIAVPVTVNPTPNATATPASQTICSGNATSIGLTSNVAGATFAWTASGTAGTSGFSNSSGSTIAQTLSTSGTTAGTVTYTVTPTAATCPGSPINVAITVNPTPNVTATPASQSICSGGTTSVNLSSNVAGATFAWTASGTAGTAGFSNSSGATIAQTLTNSGTSAGTVTYTVTPTAATCPGSSTLVTITVNPTPNAIATPAAQTICSGSSTSIALSSGVTGTTFTWTATASGPNITGSSNGSGTPIAQVLSNSSTTAGTVTYTITPTAGTCVGSTTTAVVTVTRISVATSTTNTNCGTSTGTATATPTGGTGSYTYSWATTPVQTTQTATGLAAGAYNVTVTDANGCSSTGTASVNNNGAPTVNITSTTNVSCNGGTNGSATVTASGGTGAFTYSWNTVPSQTTATASNLAAGTYAVTVTDAANCNASTTATITQPAALTGPVTSVSPSCNGGTNGSATVTAGGGTGAYTYSWNTTPSQTTATASNLAAGTYSVTVTDANACSLTSGVIVTQPTAITLGVTENDVTCNGGTNGSAVVAPSGGTGAYTYSWNTVPAQTTPTANNLAAGTYSITVTDANGCTASAAAIIEQPAAVTVSTTVTNVSCNGGNNGTATATASGGTGALTYSWSTVPSQSTPTATGLAAGTYTITVTDVNGCNAGATAIVTEPPLLGSSITSSTNVSCNAGTNGTATVTATGGSGSFTYSWNTVPSQTTATASNLSAGTYSVTVTDSLGCTTASQAIITEPADLTLSDVVVNASCSGNDGSITLTANGGTAPYQFSIDNGSTLQASGVFSNIGAGTYQGFVSDNNGCTETLTVTVTAGGSLTATMTSTNVSCFGACDGSATVTPGGGTSYTYSWNTTPVVTVPTATNLCAGTYSVTVSQGATSTTDTLFFDDFEAGAGAWTLNVATGANGADNNFWVINDNEGGVLPPGCGTGGNGDNTLHVTSVFNPAGGAAYDAGGLCGILFCPETHMRAESPAISTIGKTNLTLSFDFISMGQGTIDNASVWYNAGSGWNQISASIKSVNCGSGQGQWTAFTNALPAAAENVPNLQIGINWENNDDGVGTDPSVAINNVVVTSLTTGSVCQVTAGVVITEPAALAATTDSVPAACGLSNGSASVAVTGGTGTYTYSWNTTPVQTNDTATGLAAGTYQVTITDSLNCSVVASAVVTTPGGLAVAYSDTTNIACFGGATGAVTASATGGTTPYTYEWNPGAVTGPALSNVVAGSYTVTVTDAGGCTATNSIILTEPAAISLATASTDATCFGAANGTASVSATGGTGSYTFSWSNSVMNDTITGLSEGTYNVLVTDSNGCTNTTSVIINAPDSIVLTMTGVNPLCFGNTNGSASVSVTGGTAPYAYSWNTTSVNDTITGLGAGQYIVIVTDVNLCTATDTVDLIDPAQLTTVMTKVDVLCFGGATGQAAATNVAGGTAPYTFSWNTVPVQTNDTATGLVAGNYTVTITDASGCSINDNIQITEPAQAVTVQATAVGVSCSGASDGLATAVAVGGTGGITYVWTPTGSSANPLTGIAAGTYTITATDANGCIATDTTVVTSPSAITAIPGSVNSGCGVATGEASVVPTGGTGAYTFNWTGFPAVTGAVLSNVPEGSYTVTITDANGCSASVTVPVGEDAGPIASFTPSVTEGVLPLAVTFSNTSTNASVYSWSFGNGNSETTFNAAQTYNEEGDYLVILTATSGGCSDTASATIKVIGNSAFEIPNVFTPDNDGVNDRFEMIKKNIKNMHLVIYNRWGEKLFDMEGENVSWDGTTPSGVLVPAGTYYYIVSATGIDGVEYAPQTGFVTLMR